MLSSLQRRGVRAVAFSIPGGVLHEHVALQGLCLRHVDHCSGQDRRGEHEVEELMSPVG